MKKTSVKKSARLIVMTLGFVLLSAGMALASSHGGSVDPAILTTAQVSTATAVANVIKVGVVMIGLSFVILGIKTARRMIA